MARNYYLAASLVQLRNEINQRWPDRSKASDGWIGDAAHSSRTSDHNPNARGSVNALDVTARGINPAGLVQSVIRDVRVNYVIYNRQIWSRSRGFAPRTYSGANPHTGHVHISIMQNVKAEQNSARWGIVASTAPQLPNTGAPGPTPTPAPTVPKGLFPMSNDQYNYLKSQIDRIASNTSAAWGPLGGRDHVEEQGKTTARHVWDASFVSRGGKPVHTKQELANAVSNTVQILANQAAQNNVLSQLISNVSGNKVDMKQVQNAAEKGASDALHTHEQTLGTMLESLELAIRTTIVEAVNEIDEGLVSADPERFADEVLSSLTEVIERGRVSRS